MIDPWEEQERHEMQVEWEDAIMAENAKLRELVRCLVYATHPLDRATLIANVAELGVEI